MHCPRPVPQQTPSDLQFSTELDALAERLTADPVELVMTGRGVLSGRERLGFDRASIAVARRGIRSLLAIGQSPEPVARALADALLASPDSTGGILEEAGVEANLRYAIYSSPDAIIRIDGRTLFIEDENPARVSFSQSAHHRGANGHFSAAALARLSSVAVDEVWFSESAILPHAMQVTQGGRMPVDVIQEPLRTGRLGRRPHFTKSRCDACARCFVHCPHNAIMHARFDAACPESTGILGVDLQRCTGCGLCAAVCPPDARGERALMMMDEGAPEGRHVC